MCAGGGGGGGGYWFSFFGLRIQRHYQLGIYVAVVSARLNINKKLNK